MVKTNAARISFVAALTAFAATASSAADKDQKYTKEQFKSDVKAAGKGIKDAAVDVGHQVGSGTKKAYHSAKTKIKKDVKNGKPGDGSLAKTNEAAPTATEGHK
jgi:outer membrane lipoprotein-sorting protein